MNNLRKYTTEQLNQELLSRQICQFNKTDCTKIAEFWVAKKIGSWEIQRDPICLNCAEQIEQALKTKRQAQIQKQKAKITNHYRS